MNIYSYNNRLYTLHKVLNNCSRDRACKVDAELLYGTVVLYNVDVKDFKLVGTI